MTVKLKLFMQGGFSMPVCCGVSALRSTDGTSLYSNPKDYADGIRELISNLRTLYGKELEISVVNSWGFFALWDVLKLRITPSVPTWVLEGKKIFEGVPSPDSLAKAIDGAMTGSSM
jgi:hypothetical protein